MSILVLFSVISTVKIPLDIKISSFIPRMDIILSNLPFTFRNFLRESLARFWPQGGSNAKFLGAKRPKWRRMRRFRKFLLIFWKKCFLKLQWKVKIEVYGLRKFSESIFGKWLRKMIRRVIFRKNCF